MSNHAYRNHKHDQTWQGYQLIHAGTKLIQSFQVPALAVVKLQQLWKQLNFQWICFSPVPRRLRPLRRALSNRQVRKSNRPEQNQPRHRRSGGQCYPRHALHHFTQPIGWQLLTECFWFLALFASWLWRFSSAPYSVGECSINHWHPLHKVSKCSQRLSKRTELWQTLDIASISIPQVTFLYEKDIWDPITIYNS
jgi:hypothetical protein